MTIIPPQIFSLHNGKLVAEATQLQITDNDASSKKWLTISAHTLMLFFFTRNLYVTLRDAYNNPFIVTLSCVVFLLGALNFYLNVIRKSFTSAISYSAIKEYKHRYNKFGEVYRINLVLKNGKRRSLFFDTSEETAAFIQLLESNGLHERNK